jgi:hypothetical protein
MSTLGLSMRPSSRGLVAWGIGETFAVERLRRMPAGSFILIPAGLPHYGIVEETTVIQAHGIGPWQTTYVNQGRSSPS